MAEFSVVANLPTSVELTRRTSQNALRIDIKDGRRKIGTLNISRGSVEWWPRGNKVNARRGGWRKLAGILEEHLPKKRSSRR